MLSGIGEHGSSLPRLQSVACSGQLYLLIQLRRSEPAFAGVPFGARPGADLRLEAIPAGEELGRGGAELP